MGPSLTMLPPKNTWKRQTDKRSCANDRSTYSVTSPDRVIKPHLADEPWVSAVCDVILSDVTMQPVTEVQITVIQ